MDVTPPSLTVQFMLRQALLKGLDEVAATLFEARRVYAIRSDPE